MGWEGDHDHRHHARAHALRRSSQARREAAVKIYLEEAAAALTIAAFMAPVVALAWLLS